MPTLKFTWQKKEFPFERQLLWKFTSAFPTSKHYAELAAALVALKSPYTGYLTVKNAYFFQDKWNRLWGDGDINVRRALVENKAFLRAISDKQANDIIEMEDKKMLQSIYWMMERVFKGPLPKNPGISTDMLTQLMVASVDAIESGVDEKECQDIVRNCMLTEATTRIFVSDFPTEEDFDVFYKCYYPRNYKHNFSASISYAPKETEVREIVRKFVLDRQNLLSTWDMQARRGRWEPVFMEVSGKDYFLDLELLWVICNYCDLEKTGAALISSFIAIGHPLLQKALVHTCHLNRDDCDRVWNDGDIEACRELAFRMENFVDNLSDNQASDIMELDDLDIVRSIGMRLDDLYLKWDKIKNRRLSPEIRDNLLQFIISHKNPAVVNSLDYDFLPDHFRKALYKARKALNMDISNFW